MVLIPPRWSISITDLGGGKSTPNKAPELKGGGALGLLDLELSTGLGDRLGCGVRVLCGGRNKFVDVSGGGERSLPPPKYRGDVGGDVYLRLCVSLSLSLSPPLRMIGGGGGKALGSGGGGGGNGGEGELDGRRWTLEGRTRWRTSRVRGEAERRRRKRWDGEEDGRGGEGGGRRGKSTAVWEDGDEAEIARSR